MNRFPAPVLALALLLVLPAWSARDAAAQDHGHASGTAAAEPQAEGPPLYPNLGSYWRDVGRPDAPVDPAVAAFFNQGIRLTYGFGHAEGIRSFRHARTLDPDCAICWWGEAWALGPFINQGSIPAAREREARTALEGALARVERASPVERALIEAMAVRYRVDPEGSRAREDTLYAAAMTEVMRAFPDDPEVGTLHAEALMVLSPWNLWEEDGSPRPGTPEVLASLERVLGADLSHPGACHLYIHAVEASPDPGRAAPCAEIFETAIPGVSHVPHMPAHIFMRIGRYGDAVRGNLRAWHADQQAAFGGPPGVYPTHNLHMLAFAASYDGQSAIAMQAARDLARLSSASDFYVHLTQARFGRWTELLEDEVEPDTELRRGVWHFARGLARVRTGDAEGAEGELAGLRAAREGAGQARFRGHAHQDLLGMAEGTLAGEIHAARGAWDAAVRALEAGVGLEDGLSYDEPEPWFIPVRHVLGAVLLEAGRPAEAEAVYRAQLATHPENGWSLFGLAQALRGQGRDFEAEEVDARFQAAWARSDTWLRGSRY
jgi:tetratricopeptide (TPR) repeat protein